MCEQVARFDDIVVGICYHHPPFPAIPFVGIINSGAPRVITNNKRTARHTDNVQGCHFARISTSSRTVIAQDLGVARRFDIVNGCPQAFIVQGSENTYSGD